MCSTYYVFASSSMIIYPFLHNLCFLELIIALFEDIFLISFEYLTKYSHILNSCVKCLSLHFIQNMLNNWRTTSRTPSLLQSKTVLVPPPSGYNLDASTVGLFSSVVLELPLAITLGILFASIRSSVSSTPCIPISQYPPSKGSPFVWVWYVCVHIPK